MNKPTAIELTAPQRRVLRRVFARYGHRFARVAVFGSRAQGRARPGSDVDLVIYGGDERIMRDVQEALDESDLSITAEVKSYETIDHRPLRAEIDRDAITLFDARELTQAA